MLLRNQIVLTVLCFLLENTGTTFVFDLVDTQGVPTQNGTGILIARDPAHEGSGGTVCDDGFNHIAATVICKEMGYTCAEYWGSGTSSATLSTLDIMIDNLECLNASLPFSNCSYNSEHNCGHNEDISLRCDRLCQYEFTMVDSTGAPSTNNSGLLVATKVGTNLNGTVCDDNFGGEAALIICRSMGHQCAASWAKRSEWELQQSMRIMLDDVTCSTSGVTSNKGFTESCSWKTVNNCEHSEDIHLACGCITDKFTFKTVDHNRNPTNNGSGLLIATDQSDRSVEGTVCDDSFTDSAANTICKNMNFACSVFFESAGESRGATWEAVQNQYPIVLDNVECTSDGQCSYTTEANCKHSEDIFLYCGSERECNQAAFTFYTVDTAGVRTTNGSGLLIASRSMHAGSAGTVCDDNFNSKSAALICKEMGYKCSVGWHSGSNWDIQNEYGIYLDNIQCGPGNSSFSDCIYDTQHNCGHSEDIFLSCADDCTYNFQLVTESGEKSETGAGLLIASRNLTQESGTVCDDSFTDISASVICKEMGYKCSVFWSSGDEWALQSSKKIILDNVKCVDDSLNFLNCSFSSGGHNCNHREDVHLYCSTENCTKETISFSMIDNNGDDVTASGSGLLIGHRNIANTIMVNGTVCDDEFSLIAGNVICKEMGFTCAQSYYSGQHWDEIQASHNIVLDNVVCTEGENITFAENCTYDATHNCGHSEDIFLTCASGEDCSNARATKFALVTSTGEKSTSGAGLLIATTVRTTGTVCDDRFNDLAATAVCKEMGYECALSWSSGEAWPIQNSYSIALDNVFCETDNFTDCSFDLDHNCAHAEDVSLTCSYKCLTNDGAITAKLVDIEGRESTTGEGILLVTSKIDDIQALLFDNSKAVISGDIADTVCNKGFQMVDAMAFCRSMGYSCALGASSAEQQGTEPHAIQLTYDIMMSNVECEEGAMNLTQCNYDLVHDCDHTNDVYLTCGGVQNIARIGVASQNSTHMTGRAWKAIDGNTLSHYFEDSSTTHTQLNADSSDHVWRVKWPRQYTVDTVVLYNRGDCCQERLIGATVRINGEIVGTVPQAEGENLMKFEFSNLNRVTRSVEVWAAEREGVEALSLAEVQVFLRRDENTKECLPTFSLVNENGEPSTTGSGLLVAKNPASGEVEKGTVCDDLFSSESANVICKMMGYQCSSSWTNGDRWGIQANMAIILDDIQCPNTTSPFTSCSYSSSHNCAHTEDVFLSCDNGLLDMGCFADVEAQNGPAIPSLEGRNPVTDVHWTAREDPVAVCKLAAESKNWTVFAVQAGGWCSSSANAGETYKMYGESSDCNDNGTGGPWANAVYNITEAGLVSLGCYKDTATRAIPTMEHDGQHPMLDGEPYYRENPIEKCRKAAIASGFSIFAIQAGGYCMSSEVAGTTYKTYGSSDACEGNGLGGRLANRVYRIRDDLCSVVSKEYKFYFIDEKGARAQKSGLLIAEGTSGSGDLPGTVCDDMFNDTAATVICKEMDFSCSTGWTRKSWDEIQKQYPIVLDDVECGSDNISFSQCNFKTTSNCGHNEDIFLGCDNECLPATYTFELVDAETGQRAPNGKGLLIAKKNGTDTRGTVCDDEFTDLAATIICKEMGFVCAKGHYLQRPSTELQSGLDIVLDNIKCSNTSETFADCPYVTGHNCVHSEDVFLTCKHTEEECEAKETYSFYLVDRQLQDSTASGSGLLMANRTEEGKTGTVCDDRFNETSATIICKEMGFACATAFFNAASYKGVQENETIVLDNVECGPRARKFTDCTYQFHHDCTHNEDVFLVCQNECRGKPFAFNLVDEHGYQTINRQGLLLVHTLKSIEGATSGTVCGDNFNNASAAVICKQMGHSQAVSWSTRDHKGVQMMYPAIMNNVSCTNPEKQFDDCSYVFDHECTQDVYLVCELDEVEPTMCPAGSHFVENTCEPCARNTFKALYNADPCQPCEEGSVSGPGMSSCWPCPGIITTDTGYSQCTCPLGKVFNMNTGECQSCPPDTYNADILSTVCTKCPAGSTAMPSSTACDCRSGSVWVAGTCKQCADGTYSAADNTCQKCTNVPVLDDGSGCKCAAGSYWSSSYNSCAQCQPNTFSSEGATKCSPCREYTVSFAGAAQCTFCAEGQQWVDGQCQDCPKGTIGNKIECISGNSTEMNALSAGKSSNSWLWPMIACIALAIACICLALAVIHLRNKLKRNTITYGTDILEEAEFMEMSYEPRITDLSSADNIQLLPAEK
ncbi:hypothetical protein ACHWQZ_G013538 [Mnemiopsis leidyi]